MRKIERNITKLSLCSCKNLNDPYAGKQENSQNVKQVNESENKEKSEFLEKQKNKEK